MTPKELYEGMAQLGSKPGHWHIIVMRPIYEYLCAKYPELDLVLAGPFGVTGDRSIWPAGDYSGPSLTVRPVSPRRGIFHVVLLGTNNGQYGPRSMGVANGLHHKTKRMADTWEGIEADFLMANLVGG